MVAEKRIAFNPAVELSYLKNEEQIDLLEAMDMEQVTPSLSQAQPLKKFSAESKLRPWDNEWPLWVRKRKEI